MQIIILGMHRSGTSLVTRLVNMMGAYFAPEGASLGFSPDNPKGYWERRDAMHINDELLRANGCTWKSVGNWPHGLPITPEPLRDRIRRLVLEMDGHRPWVLKDPRLCLTLPAWRSFLEMPVAVAVHRDPREVALSLVKRDGFTMEFALALWELHAVSLLNASLELPCVFVRHAEFLREPVVAAGKLLAALQQHEVRGLHEPSAREILAFVEPKLHRARVLQDMPALSPHQAHVEAILNGEAPQPGPLALSPEAQGILHAFKEK